MDKKQKEIEDKKELEIYKAYIIGELKLRFESDIPQEINRITDEIIATKSYKDFTLILNELLLYPNHKSHQYVARLLQSIADSSSIPYVRKVLESNFEYLKYTSSDPIVITKWFSWLLVAINTDEAIDLIQEFAKCKNKGIRDEMKYRLRRIGVKLQK